MAIKVYYDEVKFRLRSSKSLKELFSLIIKSFNLKLGDISFIFVDDKKILDINVEFLNHNYFTDIITFDYKNGNVINGEIYLSIDTIIRNSITYAVPHKNEVLRVMIHGILHLCGLNDASNTEKTIMRSNENKWISEFFRINGKNGI